MSPRICHCADLHITDRPGESGATLEEQGEILKWVGTDAASSGAVVMLCAGDVFDHSSTPAERNAAIDIFEQWAAVMPVICVRGNHDRPGDLSFLSRLRTKYPIEVYESAQMTTVAGIKIACLPWPSKAGVVAWTGDTSQQDVSNASQSAMSAIMSAWRAKFETSADPCVILAHCELHGASMDSGQPVGAQCDLPLASGDLLDTGADYIALGHIHKHQVVDGCICYAGATRQCTFGEDISKGYCLVDVRRGEPPVIKHVQAPGHKLVTREALWGSTEHEPNDALRDCNGNLIEDIDDMGQDVIEPGDALRIKYTIAAENREAARKQSEDAKKQWLVLGARSVKIDETVTATTRVRSTEILKSLTIKDKLEAWWLSTGDVQEETTADRIVAKLAQLEAEVAS
jgi:DNA repair protein SbcD/Mre11